MAHTRRIGQRLINAGYPVDCSAAILSLYAPISIMSFGNYGAAEVGRLGTASAIHL